MIMDSQCGGLYHSVDGYHSHNGTVSHGPEETLDHVNVFSYRDPSVNLSSLDTPILQTDAFPGNISSSYSGASPEEAGPPDESDSDPVLRYISQVLMEGNMDDKPCMFNDPLALQAAEKPFYDALGHKYPPSPNQHSLTDHYVENPEGNFSGSSSGLYQHSCNNSSNSSSNTTSSVDSSWLFGSARNNSSLIQTPSVGSSDEPCISSLGGLDSATVNRASGSDPSIPGGFNIFSYRESIIQYQKGVEEASKFLPKTGNLVFDLNITFPEEPKQVPSMVVMSDKEDCLPEGQRVRKFHSLDDNVEGRRSKQSAVSVEEADDLSEMFDKVLLHDHKKNDTDCLVNLHFSNGEDRSLAPGIQPQELDQGWKGHHTNQGDNNNVVDLRNLLIHCAQATASDDRRTADELLKQIRRYSSPLGDGSQRLAHFFANALEARLAGTGSQIYTGLASKRSTAAQVLKAYRAFLSYTPFMNVSLLFTNHSILKVAKNREKLHIIDFGILYGFKWPMLIQCLAERPEGPPLLRITGIELPQPGFKPAERVEETGRRLAKYCKRFGVPFKYHAIAQKWETIKVEDLKLEEDEVVAVNSLFRFRYLLDETIVADSPRNAVLKLIRKIKPDVFVHGIFNGSSNVPFFISRFREALFLYSTLFDMFDVNIPRENSDRSMHEREFSGREIMNTVACEGTERVERLETYKQWQVRNTKAGLTQLPLDPELMKQIRNRLRFYHKDYVIDVDGNWTLMGWKGRITFAISAWVPS